MSRSTTTLKRLGVPSLAAVTLVAGLPLFLGTAQAAHVGSLTLTPESSSASVGTCRAFTAVLAPSAGNNLGATETVDVTLTERVASGSQTVTFCQDDADADATNNPATPSTGPVTGTPVGSAGTTTRAEFVGARATDGTITVTFGVEAIEPGNVDIRAFYEAGTGNNTFDAAEVNDTSALAVTEGNNAPANTNVRGLDAEPESQTIFRGEQATITATIVNASGDTLPGVTPRVVFNSGPNSSQAVTCTASSNAGQSLCRFTPAAAGTDTLTVFVDQGTVSAGTNVAGNTQLDGSEPQDTVTLTTAAAPQDLVITVTCGGPATDASSKTCVNPTSSTTETFSALVTAADGTDAGTDRDPVAGAIVRFTEANADATVSPVEVTTGANGVATTTLTRTSTGAVDIVVTGTIRGQNATNDAAVTNTTGQRTIDSATKRFVVTNMTVADARTLVLTPATAETVAGDARTFTATVTDRFGIAVKGVEVDFSENGPGRFISGSSSQAASTDENGRATVEVIAFRDERGAQTVTAAIGNRNAGTADDNCEQAAGFAPGASGSNTPVAQGGTSPAGVCSDTSVNNYVASLTATPSATPTTTMTPTPGQCPTAAPQVVLERATIIATGSTGVTLTGAPANSVVELFAYSRPNTDYRVVRRATINADGDQPQWRIVPPTNTRLYAQIVGCETDEVSNSVVLNVRTQLSLNVERTGKQTYVFAGDSLPARAGGLIVSLYRVTDDGRQILTAQDRANALGTPNAGEYSITRRFTGTGRFGFVVRTGQDLQNAPGASNVRSLLIF